MKIEFTKMTGAGNDFVVIDNRSGMIANGAVVAKKLCDRHWGIGADGLLLLEEGKKGSYRMMYYNADGSYGGMCGNGGRCIALFAHRRGIAPSRHQFEAIDFEYKAEVTGNVVTLAMKDPSERQMNVSLSMGGRKIRGHFINTGSPHVVIPVDQISMRKKGLESVNVVKLGRQIRNAKQFRPEGSNVNFVERTKEDTLRIRTYERGVENETLACGTGSVACAVIGNMIWRMRPPIFIIPRSGVALSVNFTVKANQQRNISLTGPAEELFRGTIEL
jgi:diaminopimelate epimerase